jgi:hypothetical protein
MYIFCIIKHHAFRYWGVERERERERGGWVGTKVSQDTVAKRKNFSTAYAGNRTPVVRPVA